MFNPGHPFQRSPSRHLSSMPDPFQTHIWSVRNSKLSGRSTTLLDREIDNANPLKIKRFWHPRKRLMGCRSRPPWSPMAGTPGDGTAYKLNWVASEGCAWGSLTYFHLGSEKKCSGTWICSSGPLVQTSVDRLAQSPFARCSRKLCSHASCKK